MMVPRRRRRTYTLLIVLTPILFVLIVLAGIAFVVYYVTPRHIWISVYQCGPYNITVLVRNELPVPIEVYYVILNFYDANGSLQGLYFLDFHGEPILGGLAVRKPVNPLEIREIPMERVSYIIVEVKYRVDYKIFSHTGSKTLKITPTCPT
ncbi:hypothetical protein [Stetteria hydrogenophila]